MTSGSFISVEVSLGPKAKRGNSFIRIVAHKNLSDRIDGQLILIRSCWIHVVERSRMLWGPIGPCKIDSNDHVELKTSPQVIDEGWLLVNLALFKDQPSRLFDFGVVEDESNFFSQLRCLNYALPYKLIFSIFLPVPYLQPSYNTKYLKFCLLGLINLETWTSKGFHSGLRVSLIH